ncbi:Cof-type HAD-IIB family hydrolase [Mucilaginibacter agri]|uniref:Cof-type HAD-IIB family hydrolase n=1 Tax=Mucilaginibacter agri TaxID=2695265 RepID=A0A966DXQ4_9SPHI|nr:Cof-type HAD-IIB family hydrolase [Mucilaginibacter agri]NCD72489.1 Cof-type HAD-IIB family hydrolase [Mucilaginibacter agri]
MNVSHTIKAVFFDIDGTLVSFKTNAVAESTKLAIQNLRNKGIKVIISTGRSINSLDHVKEIEFDGYICFNGGYCATREGTVLHRQAIDSADIKRLLDYSLSDPISFALMYEDSVKVNDTTAEVAGMYAHLNLPVPPMLDRSTAKINNVLQANIFLRPDDEPQFMREVMPNSVATRWTPLFADVNANGLSKAIGIETFCNFFGIAITETMAFGDGGNDIEMLKRTGIGVAMGNANQNVKEVADYITDDTDNDGIWKALLHYQII